MSIIQKIVYQNLFIEDLDLKIFLNYILYNINFIIV